MEISLAELEARIRACRDQEQILIYLLSDQTALIVSPDEIPKRIEALGDTYQRIIIALNALAELPDHNGALADSHSATVRALV